MLNNYENSNVGENLKFKNFSNLIIKNIFNKHNKMNNSSNINNFDMSNQDDNKNKKDIIPSLNNNRNKNNYIIQNYANKSHNNSMYIANKEEIMDFEKINFLLKEKLNHTKNNIIERIFGKPNNSLNE